MYRWLFLPTLLALATALTASESYGKKRYDIPFKLDLSGLDGIKATTDEAAQVDDGAPDYDQHITAARRLLKEESWQAAIAECDKALAFRQTVGAYALRGRGEEGRGQLRAAIASFEMAKTLAPESCQYKLCEALAACHIQRGDYGTAIDELDGAIAARPDRLQCRLTRAAYLSVLKRHEEAIDEVSRLVEQHPASQDAYGAACLIHNNAKDWDGLLIVSSEATSRFPAHPHLAHWHVVALYRARERPEPKAQLLDAAHRYCELTDRKEPQALLYLGRIYQDAENPLAAAAAYEEAIPLLDEADRESWRVAVRELRRLD